MDTSACSNVHPPSTDAAPPCNESRHRHLAAARSRSASTRPGRVRESDHCLAVPHRPDEQELLSRGLRRRCARAWIHYTGGAGIRARCDEHWEALVCPHWRRFFSDRRHAPGGGGRNRFWTGSICPRRLRAAARNLQGWQRAAFAAGLAVAKRVARRSSGPFTAGPSPWRGAD